MWRDMPLLLILICGQFILFVNTQNISVNGEEFHSKSYVAAEPIVCVDAGCVRGRVVNGVRSTYEAFYGIPYAEPPVGKLRFKNPIPRGTWTKSWDATYPRSACLQKNYFNYRQPIVGSEDCLYLNVYRPSGKYLKKNLPVLIFIHGGGFLSLSSSPSELSPDYFMATNAVIVVTFNYRLGVFGFLCSGDEAIQGNFGLKDQQLVLEWVAGNIGFFGGDENSITLAGQNAGAASVNLHMLNRKSQSLFHRAILMSGSALASPLFPIDSPHQFRMEAMASGITDWDTAPIYKLAEKVKKLDGLKLLHAVDQLFTFPGIPPVPLRPCIEGDWEGAFLTEDPKKIWAEGAFEQKPMLLSLTRNEGIVEAILTTNKTRLEEYNRNIYKLLPIQMGFNPLYTDDVLQFYFGNKKYIDHNNVDRYYQMVSDRFFRYQFFVLISQYLKYADVQKNPIYLYEFAFESSYTFLKYITGKDINLGVGHFDDLIYLFTMPGFFPPFQINTPESRMSGILVRTIVNFVAAGEIKKWRTIKPCTAITTELGCDRQVFKRYRELSPHQVVVSVTNRINGDMLKFWEVCNRTLYGDVGRTYALRVPPPQWSRLPFLCHLTFTASGHDQGDIVQIIFDGFSVGRFDEGLVDGDGDTVESNLSPSGELPGCPEGFMQLSELGRPFTGGSWCGSASGHQLYYSETATVTITVKVFHPPVQGSNPFEFRIRYKFISQSDAIVRYGAPSELLELGQVTPGTYCTRQFDECYRKKCRLQSPNYPGMYPRNVTCYWTIRQKTVPTCKHAMIGVSQESEHKALVKRSIASLNKTSRSVRAWSDCTGERDHLIFYDGSSTNDPVLAKYCGGDWLPRVVSRGSEMLVAFHSSPFSAPLQTSTPNRGFELDVDILYTDSDSYDYARGERTCEFHVNASNPDDVLMSRRGRLGRILSPRHTLPPNTTCTYYFHGYPTDLVWIYFTSYHLQILQPPVIDNTTFGQTDVPPWIIRFRVWDSSITATSGRVTPSGGTVSTSTVPPNLRPFHPTVNSSVTGNYYYYPSGQQPPPNERPVNVDNAWNPVENYIYGPTRSSVFNHNNPYGGGSVVPTPAPPPQNRYDKLNNGLSNIKETFNYIANTKYTQNQYSGAQLSNIIQQRNPETNTIISLDHYLSHASSSGSRKHGVNRSGHQEKNPPGGRKLLLEIFDNETPKLCDHTGLKEASGTVSKTRPCTPLESYVSAGNDLKIEFHTQTGTALFPATFAMQYEFVDTNLGGDIWQGRRGEETPIPPLCSRVFRKRRGDFQSPRNVFLHGRGGARNLTCLYRFEAGLGERIRINLHNVSFGDSTTCITEADAHTGRPRCVALENDADGRIGELKIFDVPYKDVRIPLGCFCDNTSSIYNTPLSFQSNARTLEISFVVTHLNVSEDFGDVYFHASYEIVRIPECRKRLRLKGAGGEDELEYPLRSHEITCEGQPWYIEAQLPERSLFVLTWGTFLPIEPNQEEILRCNTRNRLIIYSGRPLKVMRVICPTDQGNKASALHIFSEDWLNLQPLLYGSKPASMVLEPVFKEPGNLAFSWLEIQRTKASLIQQLDLQTNFTANETLGEFGFFPRHAECEHKCPELDACIGSNLWCDGTVNCPSGYDESEEECGTARKLLELPGGIFAALGCIAAAVAACFIFCIFGLVRKRKKGIDAKPTLNGTLRKDFKKSDLFMDPGS